MIARYDMHCLWVVVNGDSSPTFSHRYPSFWNALLWNTELITSLQKWSARILAMVGCGQEKRPSTDSQCAGVCWCLNRRFPMIPCCCDQTERKHHIVSLPVPSNRKTSVTEPNSGGELSVEYPGIVDYQAFYLLRICLVAGDCTAALWLINLIYSAPVARPFLFAFESKQRAGDEATFCGLYMEELQIVEEEKKNDGKVRNNQLMEGRILRGWSILSLWSNGNIPFECCSREFESLKRNGLGLPAGTRRRGWFAW